MKVQVSLPPPLPDPHTLIFSRLVENYTQTCFVCKDTSIAEGNFYLYAAFPANATNEKWRFRPQEMLRPCNCVAMMFKHKPHLKKKRVDSPYLNIDPPPLFDVCMHPPPHIYTHIHKLPRRHANPMFGLNLLVLLLEWLPMPRDISVRSTVVDGPTVCLRVCTRSLMGDGCIVASRTTDFVVFICVSAQKNEEKWEYKPTEILTHTHPVGQLTFSLRN